MPDLYPPTPTDAPADLSAPTRAYKSRAWLAFASLIAFVAAYLGLVAYLAWVTYRLVVGALFAGAMVNFLWAIPPALFCAFLVTGLFVVKRAKKDRTLIEIGPSDHPELFAFVHRLAEEARAPKPERIFLSPSVNAAVFYDLSFFNLLLPSKKQLEIGLALVNTLSLDELKAVIGHELGHFAQRTMAAGRWVYLAEQIAGNIVVGRSWFDQTLGALSRSDVRIAWIAWIMRLWVWAIRALLDTFYRVILLAHRALSREMELQADLVAVSLSGSDSLIHALHRIHGADRAWAYSLAFAARELAHKRVTTDIFEVQRATIAHMAHVNGDETFGATPELPAEGREAHRVFEAGLAQPPQMWLTHPPNHEREENCKRRYVASALDSRSAWLLFREPDELRAQMTSAMLAGANLEDKSECPIDETLDHLATEFGQLSFDRRYRGVYLGRGVAEHVESAEDLYEDEVPERDAALQRLSELYPETLSSQLERARELKRDHVLLKALADGVLTAPGGVIRHRGETVPRKALAARIERVGAERDDAEDLLRAHDRACRTVHRAAARALGKGWEDYLVGLGQLLHYADHVQADLRDAHSYLQHVLRIVLADGRVSTSERRRVLRAAIEVGIALGDIYAQRKDIELPDALALRLEHDEGYQHFMKEKYDLPMPEEHNLANWLKVIDGWVLAAVDGLAALVETALSALLEAEDRVARCLRDGSDPGEAPSEPQVPERYAVLLPGKERERQKQLEWWDRFQLAQGIVPGAARLLAAAALLAPAFFLASSVGEATVHVHNALGVPVRVSIGDAEATIPAHQTRAMHPGTGDHRIEARTTDGRFIERFDHDVPNAWSHYVYNIAGAGSLVEWTAIYGATGGTGPPPEQALGAPRWMVSSADHVFERPPTSVSTRYSHAPTRTVLDTYGDAPAPVQVAHASNDEQRRAMITAHLRFDPIHDPELFEWVLAASSMPELGSIVRSRMHDEPRHVIWSVIEMDYIDHDAACARHRAALAAHPSDPDEAYLAARCIDDLAERGQRWDDLYTTHRDHAWITRAEAYQRASRGEWTDAIDLLHQSRTAPELAPFREHLLLDEARLRRALDRPIDDLVSGSEVLAQAIAMEDNGEVDPAVEPFRALALGDLQQAVDRAYALDTAFGASILRFAAASEGGALLVERAFALDPHDGNNADSVWPTIALAVRESRDPAPFIEQARVMHEPGSVDRLLTLLDANGLAAEPTRMDQAVADLDPTLHGLALVMGIILLGESAPEQWRTDARALLFAFERPYFRGPQ